MASNLSYGMKRVLSGIMALLIVAGSTGLPANVRGGGLFARSAITAKAEELSGYVSLNGVHVGDIIGPDVEYLSGVGYTIVLQGGGYINCYAVEAGDSDLSMSEWEWRNDDSDVSAFLDMASYEIYYPYYNGEIVDSWRVVSVEGSTSTITLTGYAATQTDNPFASAVNYRQYNSSGELQDNGILDANAGIKVESGTVNWTDGNTYVVSENVTITKRIKVTGTVNLILLDGATLTASKGVSVNGVDEGGYGQSNTLNIYAGSTSGSILGTGALVADARNSNGENAGLGGDQYTAGGILNIHGGVITAYGRVCGAGIGGGNQHSHETITIYDGTINATGGIGTEWGSAGIGAGFGATGGTVYIYGGTVNATGTGGSAGIGGGCGTATNGSGGSVYIYGGTVNATGGNNSAMGIGAAQGGSSNGTLILGEGLALQNKNDGTWTNVDNTGTEDAPVYDRARNMRTVKNLVVGQYIAVGDRVYTDDMITSTSESCPHCFPENTSTVDSVIYEDNFYKFTITPEDNQSSSSSPGDPAQIGDIAVYGAFIASETERTPAPTGFWIIDGEGTADNPFILSLDPPSSVTYTYVEAVAPTCTTAGNIEYYLGSDGNYYSDDQGTLLEDQNVIIPATGHSYGTPTYSWTEENGVWKCTATRTCTHVASHIDTETVSGSYAVVIPSDINTTGTGRWTATFTNAAFESQTKDVEIAKPEPTHHAAVAPTCTEQGNIEYYTYGDVYYIKNNDIYEEIDQSDIIISALGHAFAYEASENVLTATCTHGCDEYGDGVSLFINCPDDLEYDGNDKGAVLSGLDVFNDATGLSISGDEIVYEQRIGEDYQEMDSAPIDAGTYRASLTVEGQTIFVEYDIEKIDVDESEYSAPTAIANLTYDGTPKILATGGSSEYGTMMYSFGTSTEPFENWTDDIYNLMEVYAGTYYIWYYVEGDMNHNDTDPQVIEVEVGKATLNPSVSVIGWTYGETQNVPVLSGISRLQVVAIGPEHIHGQLYKYNEGTEEFDLITMCTFETINSIYGDVLDAGTYMVKLIIEENDNYEEGEWESEEFIVAKAGSSVTAPTAKTNLFYTGNPQALINAGSAEGGQIQYSLDCANWSPDIPTGTDADAYTVYYKVVGDENHEDTEPGEIIVNIAPADPDYDVPTGLTAIYGHTLQDVVLPDGWTWDDSSISVGDAGVHTFSATFTPDDTDNYNTVTIDDITVTVLKAVPDYDVPTGLTATYGQTLADVIIENPEGNIAGTWTWEGGLNTLVGHAGEQTFFATFTPDDTDNYFIVENVEITLTVNRASNPLTVSITGWAYGEAANEPSVEGDYTDGVTYQYAVYGTEEWSDEVPTQAGEYTVKATVAESANYEAGEDTEDFVICGIDISNATILIDKDTFALSDTPCEPNVYFVTLGSTLLTVNVDYTVSYENNDGISTGTPAVVITGKGNYAGIVKKTFTIGIDLSKAEIELASYSFTYDGDEKKPGIVSVKLGGESVDQDDYEISYSDNVNAGTATVTVTAKQDNTDGVTGSASTTFTISKAGIDSVSASGTYAYTGEAIIPTLVVKDENGAVVDAANYNAELFNNVESGTAIIVVTAKDGTNYTGTKTGTFEIGHKYTAVAGVEAGCGAAGVKAHWVDENGTAYLKDTNEEYVAATAAELAIPATGAHVYNTEDIQWYWTTDNSGAFAVITCETCGTTTNVNAVVTSEAVAGGTQYTATVALGDDEYSVSKIVKNKYIVAFSEISGYELANTTGGVSFTYRNSYDGDENVEYGFLCYRDGSMDEDMTVGMDGVANVTKPTATGTLGVSDKGTGIYLRPYIKIGDVYVYGDQVFVKHSDLMNQEEYDKAVSEISGYELANTTGGVSFTYRNSYNGNEDVAYGFLCYRDGVMNEDMTVETAGVVNVTKPSADGTLGVSDKGNGIYLRSYIKIGDQYKYGEQIYVKHSDLMNQKAFNEAASKITGYVLANNTSGISFNYSNTYKGTEDAVYGFLCYRDGAMSEDMTVGMNGVINLTKPSADGTLGVSDKGNGIYLRSYIKIGDQYKYGEQVYVNHSDLLRQKTLEEAKSVITGYEIVNNKGSMSFTYKNTYAGSESAVYGFLCYRDGELNQNMTVGMNGVTNVTKPTATGTLGVSDKGKGIYLRSYIKIGDVYVYGDQIFVKFSNLNA